MSASPVSAVIPCHNCAATLPRAAESVLAQSRPPAELILVEDGSDDAGATLLALKAVADRHAGGNRIRIVRHERNLGAAAARNSGWDAATQAYIAFLDADDAWHPRKLELQCEWMEAHPGVSLTGHRSAQAHPGAPPGNVPRQITADRVRLGRLLLSNAFGMRTVMLRRELTQRFDARLRRSDDYLLWLTLVHSGREAWLLDAVLAYSFKASFGEGGLSRDLWAMEKSELAVYRELARRGAISPLTHGALVPYSLIKHAKRVLQRALTASRSRSTPAGS